VPQRAWAGHSPVAHPPSSSSAPLLTGPTNPYHITNSFVVTLSNLASLLLPYKLIAVVPGGRLYRNIIFGEASNCWSERRVFPRQTYESRVSSSTNTLTEIRSLLSGHTSISKPDLSRRCDCQVPEVDQGPYKRTLSDPVHLTFSLREQYHSRSSGGRLCEDDESIAISSCRRTATAHRLRRRGYLPISG